MTLRSVMWRYRHAIPRKVRIALADLLKIGMLTEYTVETIGQAATLSNQPQHLLGFAIGMLDRRMNGVPVADTVRMAYELGRRVNLRWSPRRWREEHDKLSRLVTVKRLREDNVEYNLSAYERHLPRKWPGYLLRSRVKLALEGHRQDHCVASYDEEVGAGRCAIATVFVDRKRWTVELVQTGRDQDPLGIRQIQGRRNRRPTAAQRRAVHEALGLQKPARPPADEHRGWAPGDDRERPYVRNLQRALRVLRALDVTVVRVTFAGSGDSGQIDDIHIHPEEAGQATVTCELQQVDHIRGQWHGVTVPHEVTVREAIHAITLDYLEHTGVDWYNNEGGQGHLEIDVEAGTVELMIERTMYADIREIDTGDSVT